MSNEGHEAVSGEERGELAYATVVQIIKAIRATENCQIQQVEVDEALRHMMLQHASHLTTHSINQTHADPYKLACWFGCALLEKIDDSEVKKNNPSCRFQQFANAIVNTLSGFLLKDTGSFRLPHISRLLLVQMLYEEKARHPDHGIWQNGLYAAFHVPIAYHQTLKLTIDPTGTCP